MAKAIVVCERDYTQEIPVTVLESYHGESKVGTIEVPGKTIQYFAGQSLAFRAKKDAAAFIKAHPAGTFRLA